MRGENYKQLEQEKLLKLAEIGISDAQEELGYRALILTQDEPDKLYEALKWFTLASDQGHVLAKFNLATMYKMGIAVDVDYSKAIELYEFCAKSGLSAAKYFLGDMHRNGLGCKKSEANALGWIQESLIGV